LGDSLRSAGALPAYQMLAAIGLGLALMWAQRRSAHWYRAALAGASTVIAVNAIYFGYLFFVRYPVDAAQTFQSEWIETFQEVRAREAKYDAVMLTALRTNQVGMLYLFWNNIEPKAYFAGTHKLHEGELLDMIVQLGNAVFLPSTYLDQIVPLLRPGARLLIAERPDIPVNGAELKRIYYPNGQLALILYDVQTGAKN
jgi:hypothetical protein